MRAAATAREVHGRGSSLEKSDVAGAYRRILGSTALIGSSSFVTVLLGIARTKILAVLLGPASFGLFGAYLLIVELGRTAAQCGINASGVREIAMAAATDDADRIARTSLTLRRTAFATAAVGGLFMLALAPGVAEVTFGNDLQTTDIAVLSLAVFLGAIAGGQTALVQGLRRIGDLARLSFVGSVGGTIASVALVYAFRERGIAPSLVAAAFISVVAGWFYCRRVRMPSIELSVAETAREASALLKLGFAFLGSGLLMIGSAYVVRTIVLRHSGLEASGLYQAAWTIGGLYVGFILQAMGADFYPRLVAAIADTVEANRLVNQQARVSLLLAAPGVLATLVLAPLIIDLLYSTRFAGAAEILRWICLGMALRVITWPIGYIIVARGRQTLFFSTELAWSVVNIALTATCVQSFGVLGTGIAFFGSYVFHGLMIYPIVRHIGGFRWSASNLRLGAAFIGVIGLVFAATQILSPIPAALLGLCAVAASAFHAARDLARLAAPVGLPAPIRRLLGLGRAGGERPAAETASHGSRTP